MINGRGKRAVPIFCHDEAPRGASFRFCPPLAGINPRRGAFKLSLPAQLAYNLALLDSRVHRPLVPRLASAIKKHFTKNGLPQCAAAVRTRNFRQRRLYRRRSIKDQERAE